MFLWVEGKKVCHIHTLGFNVPFVILANWNVWQIWFSSLHTTLINIVQFKILKYLLDTKHVKWKHFMTIVKFMIQISLKITPSFKNKCIMMISQNKIHKHFHLLAPLPYVMFVGANHFSVPWPISQMCAVRLMHNFVNKSNYWSWVLGNLIIVFNVNAGYLRQIPGPNILVDYATIFLWHHVWQDWCILACVLCCSSQMWRSNQLLFVRTIAKLQTCEYYNVQLLNITE